jgi:hypothetical protein
LSLQQGSPTCSSKPHWAGLCRNRVLLITNNITIQNIHFWAMKTRCVCCAYFLSLFGFVNKRSSGNEMKAGYQRQTCHLFPALCTKLWRINYWTELSIVQYNSTVNMFAALWTDSTDFSELFTSKIGNQKPRNIFFVTRELAETFCSNT